MSKVFIVVLLLLAAYGLMKINQPVDATPTPPGYWHDKMCMMPRYRFLTICSHRNPD